MRAWISPLGTRMSTPVRVSFPWISARRPSTTSSGIARLVAPWTGLRAQAEGSDVGVGDGAEGGRQMAVGDQLGERGAAEHRVDAVLQALPERTRGAVGLAYAAARFVVMGHALHRCDLPLDDLDDVQDADHLRGPGGNAPAVTPATP